MPQPDDADALGAQEASLKKRLMIGLAAGALVAAMLPGVASAEQPDPECLADVYVLRDLA